MRKSFACGIAFLLLPLWAVAQQTRSFSEQVRTVQVIVDDDPLLPPVAEVGTSVEICFDELSHEYTRYIYKVEYCNADWSPNTEIFESDYMTGFNGLPIEDYETSFNTTVLYTHYRFSFPSEDVRLLLPGNYRVRVYSDERDASDEPVLEACFSLCQPLMNITGEVLTNTDIDFQQRHQQLSYAVSYGGCRVVDPTRELKTVVMQNRRWDTAVVNLPPNIQHSRGVEWNHRRDLIFDAGAEFHKFEILDVRLNGLNVDKMAWVGEQYHATLFSFAPQHNYTYDKDVNGGYIIRHTGDEDNATQCEYLFVHFQLQMPRLPEGDVYVCGLWNNGNPDPECKMHYDEQARMYECGVLLKQGYYNYQFRQYVDGVGRTLLTEGDFYQTENEYLILVYYRPQGARYDALAGFLRLNNK